MSWKSIVTAGVLCVLASPAFADPTLTVTGGRQTRTAVVANQRRVWNVAVAPDLTASPTGSPLAVELGFRATGGNILSISGAQNAAPPLLPLASSMKTIPTASPVTRSSGGKHLSTWAAATCSRSARRSELEQTPTGCRVYWNRRLHHGCSPRPLDDYHRPFGHFACVGRSFHSRWHRGRGRHVDERTDRPRVWSQHDKLPFLCRFARVWFNDGRPRIHGRHGWQWRHELR